MATHLFLLPWFHQSLLNISFCGFHCSVDPWNSPWIYVSLKVKLKFSKSTKIGASKYWWNQCFIIILHCHISSRHLPETHKTFLWLTASSPGETGSEWRVLSVVRSPRSHQSSSWPILRPSSPVQWSLNKTNCQCVSVVLISRHFLR